MSNCLQGSYNFYYCRSKLGCSYSSSAYKAHIISTIVDDVLSLNLYFLAYKAHIISTIVDYHQEDGEGGSPTRLI